MRRVEGEGLLDYAVRAFEMIHERKITEAERAEIAEVLGSERRPV